MTNYRTTVRARIDLEEIGRFTLYRWGRRTSVEYLKKLKNASERLAENPSLGRNRDGLSRGILSFPVGKHLIFYTVEKDGVENDGIKYDGRVVIVRILHQSTDYQKNL